jgi:hypothetical protein
MAAKKPKIDALEEEVDGVTTYMLSIDGYKIPLHPATYAYLQTHKKGDYPEVIAKAVNVGLTAAQQGRIANSLNAVNNELKGEFALLEQFMETQQALFERDSKTKTDTEYVLRNWLREHADKTGSNDVFELSGTVSSDGTSNKTGDVQATIKHGEEEFSLAIESKMAQNFTKGESTKRQTGKGKLRGQGDTAVSQLIESRMNRNAPAALFVVDKALNPFPGPDLEYFAEPIVGFIVRVDIANNDLTNLGIAYDIVREMIIAQRVVSEAEYSVIKFIVEELKNSLDRKKFIESIGARTLKRVTDSHKKLVKDITSDMTEFDAELQAIEDAIKNSHDALSTYIKDKTFTAETALEIYRQGNAQTKYEAARLAWGVNGEDDDAKGDATIVDYDNLTVDELKGLLKEAGKPVSGPKAVLIKRLKGE